jgi:hypothetical protein
LSPKLCIHFLFSTRATYTVKLIFLDLINVMEYLIRLDFIPGIVLWRWSWQTRNKLDKITGKV